MKDKILITGSSGFIGRNFILSSPEYSILEADLLNNKLENIDFTGIECVIHLAALVHQNKAIDENEYFRINTDLTYQVAVKAKHNGVKHFIFMSTVKVYGESTTASERWTEISDCIPVDLYGKSKLEAEHLIMKLEDENFKVAIIRSPVVYGKEVKANMLKLVRMVDNWPILPLGGIDNKRSVVYVGNLIALLKKILQKQSSGIFLAGDKYSLSTTQLVKIIATYLNKRIIIFKMPDFLVRLSSLFFSGTVERLFGSLEIDNTITYKRLNLIHPFTTEEGIMETIKWYKSTK